MFADPARLKVTILSVDNFLYSKRLLRFARPHLQVIQPFPIGSGKPHTKSMASSYMPSVAVLVEREHLTKT